MGKNNFGDFLKEQRLKAGYGLRSFADAIEMQPSNLSSVEHGRIPPPQGRDILTGIAETLGLKKGSNGWNMLFDLAVEGKDTKLPQDVTAFAKSNTGIPVLLRTIENKKLTKGELKKLTAYIHENY